MRNYPLEPQKENCMPKMIFVNLPVKDLAASIRFYEAIGCEKNEQFSDDRAASMVWSETITFHLLTHDYFATFTPKPIANPRETVGMLIALSRDSREEVDAITARPTSASARTWASCMSAPSRIPTAMSSNRCGWTWGSSPLPAGSRPGRLRQDRKRTRLNSSH